MLMDVAWKRSENDLLRERLSPCILCSSLPFDRETKNPREGFQPPRLVVMKETESSVAQWALVAILSTKVSNFIKMYESYTGLDVLPAAHISVFLPLSTETEITFDPIW